MIYINSRMSTLCPTFINQGNSYFINYLLIVSVAILLTIPATRVSAGEVECGSLENHFGPWDYYDPANHRSNAAQSEGRIGIVTGAHFSNSMMRLDRGKTAVQIREDLDYTLRAIPNHPQALDLSSRFEHRRATSESFRSRQSKLKLSAECYFDRALRFSPKNPETWKLYGIHNHRISKYDKAITAYTNAISFGSNVTDVNYNIGLSYFAAGDYESAESYARKAYDNGFPLKGLKNKLIKQGYWEE